MTTLSRAITSVMLVYGLPPCHLGRRVQAQERIRAGLGLTQPALVLHSDKSANDEEWSDKLHRADLVLRVKDIKKLAPRLGTRVVLKEIEDGKHDLTLSLEKPRQQCLDAMVEWAGMT